MTDVVKIRANIRFPNWHPKMNRKIQTHAWYSRKEINNVTGIITHSYSTQPQRSRPIIVT